MNYVYADTETTGFKKNKMIQLSIWVDDGVELKVYTKYFNPEIDIEFSAMGENHITKEMVENEPVFTKREGYHRVNELIRDGILICHNCAYDRKVLCQEGIEINKYICTMKVAQYLYPDMDSHKLQVLRYALWLKPIIPENLYPHHAEYDTIVLASLFKHLQKKLTIEKMIEISSTGLEIKTFKFWKYKWKKIEDIAKVNRQYLERMLRTEKEKTNQNDDMIYTLEKVLQNN